MYKQMKCFLRDFSGRVLRDGVLVLFVTLWLSGLASAQQCAQMWQVTELAQKPEATQTLRIDGRANATVSKDWLKQLTQIKQRIDRVSGIEPLFLLCADPEPNAFATIVQGQDIVAITLGMKTLLAEDWDAYAAVLGHESAHLTLGHHRQAQTRELIVGIVQMFGSLALESLIQSGGGGAGWGTDLTALGGKLVSSAYSRENESEADEEGIRYSMAAGYDPNGAIRLHQKLNARGSFLSSHPGSSKRIEDLKKIIANLQSQTVPR